MRTSTLLASGPGWQVHNVVCTDGPHDRPFEERHNTVCIAAVTQGTFQYRTTQGDAVLAPGALLLGNAGMCFECGHEHAAGDRCLSFHYTPAYLEAALAAVPGVRSTAFNAPRLPPLPQLLPLLAAAEAACGDGDRDRLEELALQLVGAVAATLAGAAPAEPAPSRRDERRITKALRRIEEAGDEPTPLTALAREAAMSPYHFLRTFRRIVGITPHQYVLHTRMHRAAVRLRRSNEAVSTIAYDSGFNDLSTFNRRFRSIMGMSPRAFRFRSAA